MSTAKATLRQFVGRRLRAAPLPVQRAIRSAATRVLAALAPSSPAGHEQEPTVVGWQPPPVPRPRGLSLEELERTYRSWSVNGDAVGALDPYLDDSFWRFLYTWGMVRDEVGTCLEIGSNPYFTTYLLENHTKLEITLSNFYGQRGETTETHSFVPPGEEKRIELVRPSHLFNVEEDQFPFEADSFDVVLFCETIEHLLMNPVAALREIHRVLKPSGLLALTTPNVARLGNVMALVEGRNLYDPYSGFGPYGRHNREYTRHELQLLLEFAGFDVQHAFTADGNSSSLRTANAYAAVAPLVEFRRADLGQYLFVRARATGSPGVGLPSFLYRSYPPGVIVPYGSG